MQTTLGGYWLMSTERFPARQKPADLSRTNRLLQELER